MADPTMAQIDDLERRIRQSNRDDGTFGAAVDDTFELVHSIAAELLAARKRIAKLEQWTREFGAALNPHGWGDTFGEGVRAAKEQAQRLLREVARG